MFDIDADEPITLCGLEKARKTTLKLYNILRNYNKEYILQYIAFSGFKGFRLAYTDQTKLPINPRKRYDFIENNRNLFIQELLRIDKTLKFDYKVTSNPLCVIRVLGSVHSSTGYVSSQITFKQLNQPIQELLSSIPYVGQKRPGIPKRKMTKEGTKSPRLSVTKSAADASGLTSLLPTHKYFFSNRVLGLKKCYIPVLSYKESQKYYKQELLKLQDKHKLGDMYLFNYEDKKVAVFLKIMQRRQLQKLLNESTSQNKYSFMRNRKVLTPYALEFSEKINGTLTGQISRGHSYYVNPNIDHCNGSGWEQIEVVRAEYVN